MLPGFSVGKGRKFEDHEPVGSTEESGGRDEGHLGKLRTPEVRTSREKDQLPRIPEYESEKTMPEMQDASFKRDLLNAWSRDGATGFVSKQGQNWIIQFRDYQFPATFKTKKQAIEMATQWMMATLKRDNT